MKLPPDADWVTKIVTVLNANRDAINGRVRDADDSAKISSACLQLAEAAEHVHGNAHFEQARDALGYAMVEFMSAALTRDQKLS